MQHDLLYQQAPQAFVANLAVLSLTLLVMYGAVETLPLLLWGGIAFAVFSLRYFLQVIPYRRADDDERAALPWGWQFISTTLISGTLWGSAAIFLLPESLVHQVFLVLVIGTLSAYITVSYSSMPLGGPAFVLPAILPFALRFLTIGDALHLVGGVVLLVMVAVQLIVHLRLYRTTSTGLQLRLENAILNDALSHTAAELSGMLERFQDIFYQTDAEGRVVRVSPSVEGIVGYAPQELLGSWVADLYEMPSARNRFLEALTQGGGTVENYETKVRHKDGSSVWLSTNAHYLRDGAGQVVGVEGVARDITAQKSAERSRFSRQQRAMVTLHSIADGVITTDLEGRIDFLNPVAERLLGKRLHEVRGHPYLELLNLVDESTGESLDDLAKLCLTQQDAVVHANNGQLSHADGSEYTLQISASPMRGERQEVLGVVLVLHDVTEVMGITRQLNYQASHDMLTGLLNRREFEVRLEQAIRLARSSGASSVLFYMDLDQFKVVNDTCGHRAGDELLGQLAVLLQNALGADDLIARLGGDEFGVLLASRDIDDAAVVADDLRQLIKEFRFVWGDKTFEIGVSIGVVPITAESSKLGEVMSAADAACYVAKEMGRNRVHLYQPDDSAVLKHHGEMEWIHRITLAFEHNRFTLYGQPIVALTEGGTESSHYEILMRILDEAGRVIPPMAFVPAAERYHLMPTIDRWVVRTTLGLLRQAQGPGDIPPVRCSINLSGQSLSDDNFLSFVIAQFEETGVPCASVCFEITETAAVANLTRAVRFIAILRGMGCSFSLDDFGSGLSSFGYLKNLHVDYLKIDGSFVKDMMRDSVDRAMVESINQIGHLLGLRTIAEFAEDGAIIEGLRVIGVDYAQGNAVGEPQPFELLLRGYQTPPQPAPTLQVG